MVDGGGVMGKAEGAIECIGMGVIFFRDRGIGRECFTMSWVRRVFVVITKMSRGSSWLLGMIATVTAVRGRFG